ncbi:glycoside hydrolase family 5 protein [Clavulina sp. PMI_390]|nr:glycoside hydrolase family 5 protein [Clavulina sp. PMI_390]
MLFHKLCLALGVASVIPSAFAAKEIYNTTSRWIVDSTGARFKLRCVNWAGHMEANVPEGLQHRPISYIASWIANAGFNCVRLTYSIDMALSPDMSVETSFANGGVNSGAGAGSLDALYAQAVVQNPFLANATVLETFGAVINGLDAVGVKVVLDNHVSRAQWCCDLNDGNGWWDEATSDYPANSQYFITSNWLAGLSAMATWAAGYDAVIGMSIRNELREIPILESESPWYTFAPQGASAIHNANPDLLIMMGGHYGDTDLSMLRSNPLDRSAWPNKVVWEYHTYSYSVGYDTSWCWLYEQEMGAAAGFLLEQNEEFTGPLWVSEFGFGMNGADGSLSSGDSDYLSCLISYLTGNDADWSWWALQGDYYVRQGTVSYVESYGLLDANWTDWQNPNGASLLGGMWDVTQGP